MCSSPSSHRKFLIEFVIDYLNEANVTETAPAQILCFLDVKQAHTTKLSPNDVGLRAVVRSFKSPPKQKSPSLFVKHGVLHDEFLTCPCDLISNAVAVVPDIPASGNVSEATNFFVVSNHEHWLAEFHNKLAQKSVTSNSQWGHIT